MGLFGKKNKPKDEAKLKNNNKPAKEKAPASMKDLYVADAKTAPVAGTVKTERRYGRAYRNLVKPLITEKAANMGIQGKYAFQVPLSANRIEIAKAVAEVYGVTPIKVNIVRQSGKKVRYGRIIGQRKNWKKAIVTLPKGKTINIYEGV